MQSEKEHTEFDCAQGQIIGAALRLSRNPNVTAMPDDEVLAQYLDNSLSQEEQESLENTLAHSPAALSRLIFLHNELKLLLNPEHKTATVEKHHAGEQVTYDVFKSAHENATLESKDMTHHKKQTEDIPKRASENR